MSKKDSYARWKWLKEIYAQMDKMYNDLDKRIYNLERRLGKLERPKHKKNTDR